MNLVPALLDLVGIPGMLLIIWFLLGGTTVSLSS